MRPGNRMWSSRGRRQDPHLACLLLWLEWPVGSEALPAGVGKEVRRERNCAIEPLEMGREGKRGWTGGEKQ